MSVSELNLSLSNLFDVRGKNCVITGGSTGIGSYAAAALVQNGANVIIASRKEKQLKAFSDELTKRGPGKCQYIVADVSSKTGTDALAEGVKATGIKRLHVLINNSGVTWGAQYDKVDEVKGFDKVFSMNVKSLFYLTVALTDLLAAGATNIDPGRVINIASTAGISALAEDSGLGADGTGLWSYHASKAAAIHLTKTQAMTLIKRNITANAICPGVYPSLMTKWAMNSHGDSLAAGQPNKRYGTPEDIAGLVVFLSSRASAHINGDAIVTDGGAILAGNVASKGTAKL